MKSLGGAKCSASGVGGEDDGTDDRLGVADRLGLDHGRVEHRFDDEVAAGEVVVGARLDAHASRSAALARPLAT